MTDLDYRGWRRPGPIPPGGLEPADGETLEFISGSWRIFQYAKGHRYSTDDVLTAWYGTQWAPRVKKAADLGSGIGSVALTAAWRLPGARFWTVEAQEISLALARKSVAYNGLSERFDVRQGDLRDPDILQDAAPFDLVLGSPPYFPPGTAVPSDREQAVPARIEVRGDVRDYAAAAGRLLAPGGIFAFVFPYGRRDYATAAMAPSALVLLRRRDIIFREGDEPLIALFVAARVEDLPSTFHNGGEGKPWIEPPLIVRRRDGSFHPEYELVRMAFGFPPGNVKG